MRKTPIALLVVSLFIMLSSLLMTISTKAEDGVPTLGVDHLLPEADQFEVAAEAAIAIDADTGKIFYKKNADTPLPIASMTKMMTLYMVLEAIQEGKITWQTPVPISEPVMLLSQDMNLSNVMLNQDDTYTVKDLYEATSIFSANAAAIALAELLGGSEANFVDQMREKLASWGIHDGTLISASGLNNEDMIGPIYPGSAPDQENELSARDVAIIAQHLIHDFPESLETAKQPSLWFMPETSSQIEMTNWNLMLPGKPNYKEGVDGLKTGTTEKAGACFTGTLEKDGTRLITVIMNAYNHPLDSGARFVETSKLMDYVFDYWHQETLYPKGAMIPEADHIPIHQGKVKEVDLVTQDAVTQWVRNDWDLKDYTIHFTDPDLPLKERALLAPVPQDMVAGHIQIHFTEDIYGYVDETQQDNIALVTKEAVKKANPFVLLFRKITQLFTKS